MTKAEAEKYKLKYEFLVGHSFVLEGEEVIVKSLTVNEINNERDCDIKIAFTNSIGEPGSASLSVFIATIGVAFWLKYFSSLKAKV
jgi:hypothetical protein